MNKLILLIIFVSISVSGYSQNVNGNNVSARNILRSYKDFVIGENGDTLRNTTQIDANDTTIVTLDFLTDSGQYVIQPFDYVTLSPRENHAIIDEYTIHADSVQKSLAVKTGIADFYYHMGQAQLLLYYNDTGDTIKATKVLHLKSATVYQGTIYATPELADASDWGKTQGTLSVSLHDIPPGHLGWSGLYGFFHFQNTLGLTPGLQVWLSNDGSGDLTNLKPAFPDFSISMGGVANSSQDSGIVFINVTKDVYDIYNDAWDGSIQQTFDFRTFVDTSGVAKGVLTNSADSTANLRLNFSDGLYTFSAPDTITLNYGTYETVQNNYVYIDQADKLLKVSTSSYPATEHARVAEINLLDSAKTVLVGAAGNQNVNDHIKSDDDNGHILHMAERIRAMQAEWARVGLATSLNGVPDNGYLNVLEGKIWQMHKQTIPEIDMALGDYVFIKNDPDSAYKVVNNLNYISQFSDGSIWNNAWGKIVVWVIGNKTGEPCHAVVNLPSDGYLSEENAIQDADNYADFSIPDNFRGKGVLTASFVIRISPAGITYNEATGYKDLRGYIPNNTIGSGGGSSGVTEYVQLGDTPSLIEALAFQRGDATGVALENVLADSIYLTEFNSIGFTLEQSQVVGLVDSIADHRADINQNASDIATKQNNISLTTNDFSGAATFASDILNVPNYVDGLTSGYIPYFTTKLVNSPVYTDGTNTGIGTTNPVQSPSDVFAADRVLRIGDNSGNPELRLAGVNSDSTSSRIVFDNSSTGQGMSLIFSSDATSSFGNDGLIIADENGFEPIVKINRDDKFIGIGTMTPSANLDIVGTAKVSATPTGSTNVVRKIDLENQSFNVSGLNNDAGYLTTAPVPSLQEVVNSGNTVTGNFIRTDLLNLNTYFGQSFFDFDHDSIAANSLAISSVNNMFSIIDENNNTSSAYFGWYKDGQGIGNTPIELMRLNEPGVLSIGGYPVYHSGNSNLPTVDWNARELTVAAGATVADAPITDTDVLRKIDVENGSLDIDGLTLSYAGTDILDIISDSVATGGGDGYVSSATFNTGTGVITLNDPVNGAKTVELSGLARTGYDNTFTFGTTQTFGSTIRTRISDNYIELTGTTSDEPYIRFNNTTNGYQGAIYQDMNYALELWGFNGINLTSESHSIGINDGGIYATLDAATTSNVAYYNSSTHELTYGTAPSGGTFSGAKARHTSSQTINTTTGTTLLFNSEDYDTDSYHSTSTNTSRITVPSNGYYQFTIDCQLNLTSAGIDGYYITWEVNGATEQTTVTNANINAIGIAVNHSISLSLSSGDYVEVTLTSIGEDAVTDSDSGQQTTLSVNKM